jgi:ParB family chromosome partitioning protein
MKRIESYDCYAIPCERIFYDTSFNCRGLFTLDSVRELADSIEEIGRLMVPVWVQPACDVAGIPDGFDYRLMAGHRRYKAVTTFLKWPEIPAHIFRGLTERQARLMNFTENLERKDLNPLEEAMAIGNMPWPDGMTIRSVSRELKRNTRWVHQRLRVLELPEEIQQLVAARRVTMLDLEIIFRKTTTEDRIKAANALAASKKGRGRNAKFVGEKLTRSFRRRRNKSEINALITKLLNLGLSGLVTRVLAWAAGHVTDEEIEADIQAAQSENRNAPVSY